MGISFNCGGIMGIVGVALFYLEVALFYLEVALFLSFLNQRTKKPI